MHSLLDDLPVRPDGLIMVADAAAVGRGYRVHRLHQAGTLTRIWPGVYAATETEEHRGPRADAARYLRRVRAAAHQMPGRVFTSYSAAALVAADAALRHPPYAKRPPLLTPEALMGEHERLRPYRGHARAAAVLCRATPFADGGLESISRLVIEELGFAAPELQHRFWLPGLGEYAWVDFYWPELGIAMEADGHGKYLDAGSGERAAQRVVREKRREDEIRAQVEQFGRWDWDDAWRVHPLERKLERAGVPRIRPRRRLFVP